MTETPTVGDPYAPLQSLQFNEDKKAIEPQPNAPSPFGDWFATPQAAAPPTPPQAAVVENAPAPPPPAPARQKTCLFCQNKSLSRGLCKNHYWQAKAKVDRGDFTWGQLEGNGVALPLLRPEISRSSSRPRKQKRVAKAGRLIDQPLQKRKKSGPKPDPQARSKKPCLYPGCKERGSCGRGLCGTHYHVARKLVKKGRTTWDKLIASGKCAAPVKQLPPSKADAVKWFLSK